MQADLMEQAGIELVHWTDNLVDNIWTTEEDGRPEFVAKDIVIHPMEFAGLEWETKLTNLRSEMTSKPEEGQWMLVNEKDEIAWLFNLRGEGSSSLGVRPTGR